MGYNNVKPLMDNLILLQKKNHDSLNSRLRLVPK